VLLKENFSEATGKAYKQKRVVNSHETWVRADGAYPSVISRALFERGSDGGEFKLTL
jgi:hypothetical protein